MIMKGKKSRLLVFLVALMSIVLSCNSRVLNHQTHYFESAQWNAKDTIVFALNKVDLEKNKGVQVNLELQVSQEFTYQNIWLYVEVADKENIVFSKPLNFDLFNADGTSLGRAPGIYKDYNFNLGIFNNSNKNLSIRISPYLRDNVVNNINRIGILLKSES